jgi:hypothetical protein
MQFATQARRFAVELRVASLAFLRGLRSLLEASRLTDALLYGLAVIVLLVPISFIGSALNWALARQSIWLAFTAVGFAAALLILFAALMTNEQFLRDIQVNAIKWPSLLSIALGWLAVLVFGGLSCGFERVGLIQIHPSVPFAEGCATRYADMYLWHLFDSIPGIKFTETVGWAQRYSYSDNLSAWLLVSFKLLVIVSVIGSFVVCGRLRREKSIAAKCNYRPGE